MQEFKSLADLLDLQAVDSHLDRLLEQRSTLPELQQYRRAHAASVKAKAGQDELAGTLTATSRQLDKTEGELEILEQKLHQEERRLFAGGLSAREAEHLRMEVASLKRRQGEMEESILEMLDAREALEAREKEAAAESERLAAEEHRLEGVVADAWKSIDAEIARREERKRAIVSLIDPDLIEMYEDLRRRKEGVAIGRLADGICGGCHLTLSAAEQLEVLRDDPPRCLHCRRLLVP